MTPPHQRSRDRKMLLRGSLVIVGLLVGVLGLLAYSRGDLNDNVEVTAQLASVGDGLAPGADVKYRGVLVGRVMEVDTRTTGGADVRIRIRSQYVDGIPATVKVRRVPSNVFAQPSIELTDSQVLAAGPSITSGAVLSTDTSKKSLEIQTAIDKAYELVTALRPAELSLALDALADALDGQGMRLNSSIARADAYFGSLAANRGDIDDLLRESVDAMAVVRRNSPDLLATVKDALVPARTIARSQAQISAMLAGGIQLANLGQRFLDANERQIITVLGGLRPVAQALGDDRRAITSSFTQLGKFVAWGPRIPRGADGPIVRLDFRVNDTFLKPYTAADCAKYPSAGGLPAMVAPNCSRAAGRAAPGGAVGPVGSASEKQVVDAIARALAENPDADFGDVPALLLGPLLRGNEVSAQ